VAGSPDTVLVVIRGDSGSGRSSIARELRRRHGRGCALVEQDYLRRILLRERDEPDGAAPALIVRLSADKMRTALKAARVRAGATRISAYVVAGKGMYSSFDSTNIQAAMKMIGRPAVRYTFIPEPPELEHYIKGNIPAPTSILTEDVHRAGTRTTHDDGSTDSGSRPPTASPSPCTSTQPAG
jgi:hypothetical protein